MENWKDVVDYEGLYQVSDRGRVKVLKRAITRKNGAAFTVNEKIFAPQKDRRGYFRIQLSKTGRVKNHRIHRLVARAFIGGEKTGLTVNHKNGNKQQNNIENLEWLSNTENIKHSYSTGMRDDAIGNMFSLTRKDAADVRGWLLEGFSLRRIARAYSVSASVIFNIKTNENYGKV